MNVVPLASLVPLPVVAPVIAKVTEATEQLSPLLTGAIPLTTAVHTVASVLTTLLPGQVIVGFSLSVTVTRKLQVALLFAASLTV